MKDIEIVVARYNEDLKWLNKYASTNNIYITIYNKGINDITFKETNNIKIISLHNVGRESHTYLYHIINNWDTLAQRTIFFQGGGPSFGYRGANNGGHMFSNYNFEDYIISKNELEIIITARVLSNLTMMSIRNGYDRQRKMLRPINIIPNSNYDKHDRWLKWNDFKSFKKFIENKRKNQNATHDLKSFWKKYISNKSPLPSVLMYAQGAQFSITNTLIHSNSKNYYEELIQELEHDKDCYQGYFMEWLWLYVFSRHNLN